MRILTKYLTYLKGRVKAHIEQNNPCSISEMLIVKALSRMKVKPFCPHCNSEMMFRHSTIGKRPFRDDIFFKCPKCFFICGFGVPLTKKEYERDYHLRNGKALMRPDFSLSEYENAQILRRLKALGYLG